MKELLSRSLASKTLSPTDLLTAGYRCQVATRKLCRTRRELILTNDEFRLRETLDKEA